ncbi:hypothetical protein ABT369_37160 [Dactylosporangium sp. NPDC000244]|uniref:hypothetical protein n=1 Tax=Dactylosporangium sp. NPDC000244 TaxID=3154365 RepID=UPI0033283C07
MGYELHIARVIPWIYCHRFPIGRHEVRALLHAEDWLRYDDGRLCARDPGEARVRRMLDIAAELDAWLLGDGDTIFGVAGDRVVEREATHADLPFPRTFVAAEAAITAARWAEVVAAEPDLEWRTRIRAQVPSGATWIDCPAVACWTGHPSGEPVPFFHSEYEAAVEVWRPDSATLTRVEALEVRLALPS